VRAPVETIQGADEGGVRAYMPRILIVDDDADAADALASLLQSTGYGDARTAYTGATALALAVEFVPTSCSWISNFRT